MERLIIYDADSFDCTDLYELGNDSELPAGQLIVGERPHPLSAATADETATIAVILTRSQVDKPALIRLPKLKLLVTLSDDTSHIDLNECATRDVAVHNLPASNAQAEAEYTMALMLALSRRLPKAITDLHAAKAKPAELTGSNLAGKTLTIIGTNDAGQQVAALAQAFGMQVLMIDPQASRPVQSTSHSQRAEPHSHHQPKLNPANLQAHSKLVGLHDGLKKADIIGLHCPLTSETRHILNQRSLAITKRGVLIINTASGGLIDTTALLHALHTHHVGGAALDTIEHEHQLAGSVDTIVHADGRTEHQVKRDIAEHEALLKLPNVIMTHRNAANTYESQTNMARDGVAAIRSFLLA